MRFAATLRIALRALRRNKLRTGLTMLGIVIGVGAVVAMVGIGSGAKAQVEAQIASLGENVILVMTGSTTSSGVRTGFGMAGTLKIEDVDAILREVPGVVAASGEVRSTMPVASGNQNWMTQILGESPDYFGIRQWPLKSGAIFTEQDVRGANKVCVIGQTTAAQIFGDVDPIGEIIRIKQVPFVITGVLSPKGMSMGGSDQDDVVILPYTSAMKRVMGQTTLRGISVQTAAKSDLAPAQQQMISLLRQRHRIAPGKDDDFIGRAALVRLQGEPLRKKLVSIVLDGEDHYAWGGEALVIDGEPVGEIASAGWSDAAGRCVGLGYLHGTAAGRAHAGSPLTVDLWGEAVAATAWDRWSPRPT